MTYKDFGLFEYVESDYSTDFDLDFYASQVSDGYFSGADIDVLEEHISALEEILENEPENIDTDVLVGCIGEMQYYLSEKMGEGDDEEDLGWEE